MSVPLTQSLSLVVRSIFIELLRKKDFYVLLILMGLYLLGVYIVSVVGVDSPTIGTFLLNLGMSLSSICAHILVLLIASGQVPREMENRTLYPLLAKPLKRWQYLTGVWMAAAACGALTFFILGALAWGFTPKMEYYSLAMLLQAIFLQVVSLGALAALTLLLSLLVPRGVNMILVALVAVFGSSVTSIVSARFAETPVASLVHWVMAYVPDFSKLNLITRYTDGIAPLGTGPFIGLLIYGGIITGLCLAVAVWRFDRQPL
jgi:ABC-type transport system involved in multi-copper enzyme maturation permease subunit